MRSSPEPETPRLNAPAQFPHIFLLIIANMSRSNQSSHRRGEGRKEEEKKELWSINHRRQRSSDSQIRRLSRDKLALINLQGIVINFACALHKEVPT